MSDIKLIVGLGNPGEKYALTRHNVGFMLIDHLAEKSSTQLTNHLRWRAHIAKIPESSALLMKPQTFMNESGRAISAALRFYKWEPEQVLVIYDDAALPFSRLRFRMKGSAGGHNGIRSMINHLGTDQFARLKIGIGNVDGASMVGHVLGKFSQPELNELENTLATAAEAVQFALSQGVEAAATKFNTSKNQDS